MIPWSRLKAFWRSTAPDAAGLRANARFLLQVARCLVSRLERHMPDLGSYDGAVDSTSVAMDAYARLAQRLAEEKWRTGTPVWRQTCDEISAVLKAENREVPRRGQRRGASWNDDPGLEPAAPPPDDPAPPEPLPSLEEVRRTARERGPKGPLSRSPDHLTRGELDVLYYRTLGFGDREIAVLLPGLKSVPVLGSKAYAKIRRLLGSRRNP